MSEYKIVYPENNKKIMGFYATNNIAAVRFVNNSTKYSTWEDIAAPRESHIIAKLNLVTGDIVCLMDDNQTGDKINE